MQELSSFTPNTVSTRQIGHLGLVAGVFDELGISGVIDEALPKTRDHILPHSAVVKAMVLNGLGFNERRLYIFSRFFDNLSTEQLLGPGITPEHLNDDVLLRTLDRIYEYGSTDLFNRIAVHLLRKIQFGTQLLHVDTTSFSVHGEYEGAEDEERFETIRITHGHNKDHRFDLKQFVISLVTNQHGIPLYTQPYSGNASDKKILVETIQRMRENLDLQEKAYYIADSAFYSAENLATLGRSTFWITRVPATLSRVEELLHADLTMSPGRDARYSFHECTSDYAGIRQKWVVVHSEEMQKRQEKTFEKNLEKRVVEAKKSLKKLKSREFVCAPDAERAAERWFRAHPFLRPQEVQVVSQNRKKDGKRGRPGSGDLTETVYTVDLLVEPDPRVVEEERSRLGRFVLATNDPDLDAETILRYYKGQQSVERGFRFLKDRSFRVAEVFLKKESRIEALSMIMVLCLLVYALAEWQLRTRLRETGRTVKNQLRKPVQNPTLKWIFTLFMRPAEVSIVFPSGCKRFITNLDEEVLEILEVMGPACRNYYFVRETCEM